jgi:hypothetical protein
VHHCDDRGGYCAGRIEDIPLNRRLVVEHIIREERTLGIPCPEHPFLHIMSNYADTAQILDRKTVFSRYIDFLIHLTTSSIWQLPISIPPPLTNVCVAATIALSNTPEIMSTTMLDVEMTEMSNAGLSRYAGRPYTACSTAS